MPFYEYVCDSCGHEVELMQKMSDPPLKDCPECGEDVRKKIFAPPVILKGGGFYETEYGRAQHNNPDKKDAKPSESTSTSSSDSKSSSSSDSSSKGSSEAKPAKKSETKASGGPPKGGKAA